MIYPLTDEERLDLIAALDIAIDHSGLASGSRQDLAWRELRRRLVILAKLFPGGEEPCTAMIWHGPGHQSSTRCELTGPHDVHHCRYGSYEQLAQWRGLKAFSGAFDEPPVLKEAHDGDHH